MNVALRSESSARTTIISRLPSAGITGEVTGQEAGQFESTSTRDPNNEIADSLNHDDVFQASEPTAEHDRRLPDTISFVKESFVPLHRGTVGFHRRHRNVR